MTNSTTTKRLHSSIEQLINESISCLKYAKKIRNIFLSSPQLTSDTSVDEALKSITLNIQSALECDRATVYSLDHNSNLLWAKTALGKWKPFSVKLGEGIAGLVAENQTTLNIRDAYENAKFDSAQDVATGYRTRTMLVMPIRNEFGYVEGVIQAINKSDGGKGEPRIFDSVDEGLLEMLGRMAGMFLKSTLSTKKQRYYLNTLRQILQFGVYLMSFRSLTKVCQFCEKQIGELFSSPEVKLFIFHPEKSNCMVHLEDNANFKEFRRDIGLVNIAITTQEIQKIENCANHPDYNGLVDMNTTMSVTIVPIISPVCNKMIGVLQLINPSVSKYQSNEANFLEQKDFELIDFVTSQLSQILLNLNHQLK